MRRIPTKVSESVVAQVKTGFTGVKREEKKNKWDRGDKCLSRTEEKWTSGTSERDNCPGGGGWMCQG